MNGRRLILHMSVSLDGFAAGPDHVVDWMGEGGGHGDQRHRMNLELLGQIDVILLGRRAYEEMGPAWSSSDSPMARLMNDLPKVVFSHGEETVGWANARVASRPLADEVAALKAEGGRDMAVFGGAQLGQSLIRERLVDEYRLTVHPVMLGAGLPLMAGLPEPQRLELVSSTTYTDGCVGHVLRPR